MKPKVQQEKTKRHKNGGDSAQASRVAAICQCSPRMVRYALSGQRGKCSQLAPKIKAAHVLLKQRDGIAAFIIREKINPA